MPLQWSNQIWQSLEEGARKRCSECGTGLVTSYVFQGVLNPFSAQEDIVLYDITSRAFPIVHVTSYTFLGFLKLMLRLLLGGTKNKTIKKMF